MKDFPRGPEQQYILFMDGVKLFYRLKLFKTHIHWATLQAAFRRIRSRAD